MAPLQVTGLWQGFRPRRSGRRRRLRRGEVQWALQDINFAVDAGEMLGVIGGNGSGKSTLLRTLSGVLKPVRGEVSVTGSTASLMDLVPGLHRDLTGRESLMINGALLGLRRDDLLALFDSIVRFSGLDEEIFDQPIHTYSTGMFLRQAVALVLHSGADVLAIDEILSAADVAFQENCLERVAALKSSGCAIVMVSHNLEVISDHCDRAAVLESGKLTFLGSVHEAVHRYRLYEESLLSRQACHSKKGRLHTTP